MKDELLNILILKHLQGQTTVEEAQQFEQWLAENKGNQQRVNEINHLNQTLNGMDFSANPNTEDEWMKFKQNIHSESAQIVKMNPLGRILRIAAVFLGLLTIGWFLFKPSSVVIPTTIAEVHAIEKGATKSVQLADGSTIYLNADTKLSVYEGFNENSRRLKLEGEAFFEVARDENLPFIIEANGVETKVLGTSFNIKAYPEQTDVQLNVKTGIVEFKSEKGQLVLEANKAASFQKSNQQIEEVPFDDKSTAWQNGNLSFSNATLTEILLGLERKYGTTIIDNSDKGDSRLTEEIDSEDTLEDVLERLQITASFDKIIVEEGRIEIQ